MRTKLAALASAQIAAEQFLTGIASGVSALAKGAYVGAYSKDTYITGVESAGSKPYIARLIRMGAVVWKANYTNYTYFTGLVEDAQYIYVFFTLVGSGGANGNSPSGYEAWGVLKLDSSTGAYVAKSTPRDGSVSGVDQTLPCGLRLSQNGAKLDVLAGPYTRQCDLLVLNTSDLSVSSTDGYWGVPGAYQMALPVVDPATGLRWILATSNSNDNTTQNYRHTLLKYNDETTTSFTSGNAYSYLVGGNVSDGRPMGFGVYGGSGYGLTSVTISAVPELTLTKWNLSSPAGGITAKTIRTAGNAVQSGSGYMTVCTSGQVIVVYPNWGGDNNGVGILRFDNNLNFIDGRYVTVTSFTPDSAIVSMTANSRPQGNAAETRVAYAWTWVRAAATAAQLDMAITFDASSMPKIGTYTIGSHTVSIANIASITLTTLGASTYYNVTNSVSAASLGTTTSSAPTKASSSLTVTNAFC